MTVSVTILEAPVAMIPAAVSAAADGRPLTQVKGW